MWGAVLGAVAGGAVSGMFGAQGAKDAARAQTEAADLATAENRRQFDLARADSAPWRDAGSDAINRLRYLLGLGTPPGGRTLDQIASELRSSGRFNVPGQTIEQGRLVQPATDVSDALYSFSDGSFGPSQYKVIGSNSIDEAGLMAEAQRLFEAQQAAGQDPDFGSLNRRFTIADFEADPVNQLGFKFGMDEGTKAIRRMLGATGMAKSGAAVKALTRFGQDYAGSKASESRNRFIQDQDITFNRLAGISGVGQTATQQTNSLGANMANQIGQNIIGAGNARGAAAIAQGNAIGAPFAAAGNMISTKFLLDSMRNPTPAPRFSYADLGDVYS